MNLYQKIHAIMSESDSLEKNLTVGDPGKGSSYKAVGEAEVLNNLKPLFKKHGLICLPVDGELNESNSMVETEYNGIKKSTARNIAQLKCYFELIDIETGESKRIVGFGYGADNQDKGSGKAFTYSYKTALSKSFMLFSGEDTDNEHSDDIGQPKKPYEPKKPEAKVNLYVPPTQPKPSEVKQTTAPATQTPPQGKSTPTEVKVEVEEIAEGPKYTCVECTLPIKAITTDKNRYSAVQVAEMTIERTGRQLCWACALKESEAAKAEAVKK